MFWNKPKNVEQALVDRVSKLETRLTRLEAEILDVATAQDIIRNKVLRKIQNKKEEEPTEKPKDLYNGMLLTE